MDRYNYLITLTKSLMANAWHQCCYIVSHRMGANTVMSDEVEVEMRRRP